MCCVTACLKCDPLLCANQARQAGEVSKGPQGRTLESQTTEIFGCSSDQNHILCSQWVDGMDGEELSCGSVPYSSKNSVQ